MEEDEKMGSTETAEESVAENESKEENMETEELNAPESAATPAPEAQADGVLATEFKQTSAEKTEANEDAATPQADNDGPPNAEEAQTSGSHVRPDCQEPPMPELPKVNTRDEPAAFSSAS